MAINHTVEEADELYRAAMKLRDEGYRVSIHKLRTTKTCEIISISVYCPREYLDEQVAEVSKILAQEHFLIHKLPNEESIHILPKNKI